MKYKIFLIFIVSAALSALSFEDVLASVDETSDVISARNAFDIAVNKYALLVSKGDFSLSVEPEVAATTSKVDIATNVAINIPLLYTAAEKEAIEEAAANVELAKSSLTTARNESIVSLLSLYNAAYFAQENYNLLQEEVAVQVEIYNKQNLLFQNGDLSATALFDAADDLDNAQQALYQAQMEKNLTWLELALTAKIDSAFKGTLEPVSVGFPELPHVNVLVSWLKLNSSQLETLESRVAELLNDFDSLSFFDITPSLRASLLIPGINRSISLNYNAGNGDLSASSSIPVYSYNFTDTSGSNSTSSPELVTSTLGIDFTFSVGNESAAQKESLNLALQSAEIELAEAMNKLELTLRSAYQKYQLAVDQTNITQLRLDQVIETKAQLDIRREQGSATELDVKSSELQVLQNEYKLALAQANELELYFQTASAAAYLNEIMGDINYENK